MSAPSAEAREWQRIIRASVRECLETWVFQAEAGPVTVDALETILARATVPILRQVEERRPELVMALLPSLVRTMLSTFVEMMAEQRAPKVQDPRAARPDWCQMTRAATAKAIREGKNLEALVVEILEAVSE